MPHIKQLNEVKRVYLIGICGTAMASLAGMLQQRGYEVAGSDEHVYPPMSTYLERLRIPVLEGYTKQHLETFRPDLVVIGNVAANTNPEAAATVEMDLPYTSMPEAIYHLFIKDRHSIVVTGTHGKTTTTSLMAWILEAAGRDPSMVVGGIPVNFNQNFKLGDGADFVIEGDEYNTSFFDKGPKFLHYHANTLLVNNIEFDHADIYANLDAIVGAFRKAVEQVAPGDVILANGDDANVRPLRTSARGRWITFGWDEHCDTYATHVELLPDGSEFTAWWEGKEWARFRTTLSGRHNVLNALADAAIARLRGLSADEIQKGLETFQGIKRRMEVRGVERGVTVIDDFAHHPTAIATTLDGARKRYPGRKIWALFEPRSISSSRKEFESGYIDAFHEADRVVIGPIFHRDRYETRYGLDKMMSVPAIVERLRHDGIPVTQIDNFDAIAAHVAKEAGEGDVVLVMSSGAFGGVHEKILEALRSE
ncbi:MAG: UDP-N-acetylmuramate:L-alanyl-gamma-D-glutamyl-meso-diaminopimelate ligase [Acidobacteria bacterium]|nr:UDP-N-acetylmuramate:L-alanyl-gamma-D-glutamyl-meso-diaminopimelate ligase [Acidobacteriota bacterium]MBV9476013.1 UDP-N-acetylmuramate:L-alanyl-gamma-D-glutamyl-meso-diaminopimelate ligase [Acidobacteriota bacterium]